MVVLLELGPVASRCLGGQWPAGLETSSSQATITLECSDLRRVSHLRAFMPFPLLFLPSHPSPLSSGLFPDPLGVCGSRRRCASLLPLCWGRGRAGRRCSDPLALARHPVVLSPCPLVLSSSRPSTSHRARTLGALLPLESCVSRAVGFVPDPIVVVLCHCPWVLHRVELQNPIVAMSSFQ